MEIRKRHQREVCEALRLHGDDGLRRSGRLGKPGATAGGRRIGLPVVASLAEHTEGQGGSDKISVPEFTGEDDKDGLKARGYLRKVEAWRRVTRTRPQKQALMLYNALSGRAWLDAEDLDLTNLDSEHGVEFFKQWITEKYLDREVVKVGKYLTDFFKTLKKQQTQDIREFNAEFDRQLSKLREVGCTLPDVCAAWLYLDKLRLDNVAELSLLSSTGNLYALNRLQEAAVIQDRGNRRLWEGPHKAEKFEKFQKHRAYIADAEDGLDEEDDDEVFIDEDEPPPDDDEDAQVAYVAFQNAKAKYQAAMRARGTVPQGQKDERIKLAKARSYCSVCKQKGHWHKDPECPANKKGGQGAPHNTHIVFYTGAEMENIGAITDCACSRTLAGPLWEMEYKEMAKDRQWDYLEVEQEETFKFGGKRLFPSRKAVVAWMCVKGQWFLLKVSIVQAQVPLLLSRPVLAALGMVYNLEKNEAHFTNLKT